MSEEMMDWNDQVEVESDVEADEASPPFDYASEANPYVESPSDKLTAPDEEPEAPEPSDPIPTTIPKTNPTKKRSKAKKKPAGPGDSPATSRSFQVKTGSGTWRGAPVVSLKMLLGPKRFKKDIMSLAINQSRKITAGGATKTVRRVA